MRKRIHPITLTLDQLKAELSYDPDTGVFTWLRHPEYPAKWNTRYAGKPAGSVLPKGYRIISINDEIHYAHRLAWLWVHGEWPTDQIDHINRNKDDNRIANLRQADNGQNNTNRPPVGRSGIKGVSWYEPSQKWRARISKDRTEIYLGYFDTIEEAIKARNEAAVRYHGEFADLIVT
jgi:hypothetical protein